MTAPDPQGEMPRSPAPSGTDDDDRDLHETVRRRAAKPASSRITMTLDELKARHADDAG
mgnify:CR=1 FL=1